MIEINLLPEEFRKKEGAGLSLPDVPLKKALFIFFPVFFGLQILLSAYAFFQASRVGMVQAEIERLKSENKAVTRQKNEISAMRSRIKDATSLMERTFFWTKLLAGLTDSVTRGVWINNFSVLEGKGTPEVLGPGANAQSEETIRYVRMEGSVVGQGEETAFIGKFIKELKENPVFAELFEDIKLSAINQKKIRDVDVYDFVLVCIFKKGKI